MPRPERRVFNLNFGYGEHEVRRVVKLWFRGMTAWPIARLLGIRKHRVRCIMKEFHLHKRAKRFRNHPISEAAAHELLRQQGGKCANTGCGIPITLASGGPRTQMACIDHDHKDGHVRGLLCFRCNIAGGFVGDSARKAVGLAKYFITDNNRRGLKIVPVRTLLETRLETQWDEAIVPPQPLGQLLWEEAKTGTRRLTPVERRSALAYTKELGLSINNYDLAKIFQCHEKGVRQSKQTLLKKAA